MNRTIRYGTFETNSSSVHSLIISQEGMCPSELKIEKSDGKIHIPLKYWGKEYGVYDSQLDKLSYLCTRAWSANHWWPDTVEFDDSDYVLKCIEEAICEYTEAKGIDLYVSDGVVPGFDHQTQPEYSDDMNGFCNIYDKRSIQNFVFNKYISFETGCD